MMETAWRRRALLGATPEWMDDWMELFAQTIDAAKNYVVSTTLERGNWTSERPFGN